MEEFLKIGIIVKPQGVKGEVKVQPLTSDVSRFKNIKEVYIDGKTVKVLNAKVGVDAIFMSFSGVVDRNTAELYRGKFLYVDRPNAIALNENTFFIADIIGSNLEVENGEVVGKIIDVTELKTDIFTVRTVNNKIMRFPFLKDLLIKVDSENSIVIVKEKRLKEVSVYED